MALAHRNGDKRFCDGETIVEGNSTVFVNGKLWAIEGNVDSHEMGNLVVIGQRTVKIGGIPAVGALKDTAVPDLFGHMEGPVDPLEGSPNVFVYGK